MASGNAEEPTATAGDEGTSPDRSEVFRTRAAEYSFWEHTVSRERHAEALSWLPGRWGRVLDAGCASGALALALAERAEFVDGIDESPELVALARERAARSQVANVRFVVMPIADIPRGSYDLVTCCRVLHHLDWNALKRLRQSLSPGGRLLLLDLPASPSGRETRWTHHVALTVGSIPRYVRRYGVRATWRIMKLRLSRPWLSHVCSDQRLSPERFDLGVREVLPGARVAMSATSMIAYWQAPQRSSGSQDGGHA